MPELHTARLVLRPLGPADLDAVHRYASDRALTRLVAHCDARNRPSARLMERLGMTLEDAEGERTYPKTGETARELCYAMTFPGEEVNI